MEDGEIRFRPENRDFAYRVHDIYGEVQEYMTAFERAAPDTPPPKGVDKNDFEGRGVAFETRTLLKYNGAELAGRYGRNGGADFVSWRLDRNGERELGHYHDSYAAAKEDFAVRAGLIDRNKLFTETELTVIKSSLSAYLSLDDENLSDADERTLRGVVEKIDRVITPTIQEQEDEAEDQGFEPELEL
jgi:hypothetical protein